MEAGWHQSGALKDKTLEVILLLPAMWRGCNYPVYRPGNILSPHMYVSLVGLKGPPIANGGQHPPTWGECQVALDSRSDEEFDRALMNICHTWTPEVARATREELVRSGRIEYKLGRWAKASGPSYPSSASSKADVPKAKTRCKGKGKAKKIKLSPTSEHEDEDEDDDELGEVILTSTNTT
jgi:hypothetical protein